MKKQIFKKISVLTFSIVLIFATTSCSNDNNSNDEKEPVPVNFGITTVSGAWPNQTSYIQGLTDLNFSTIGNENAAELTGNASTVSYNGSLYASPFGAPATLVKYSFNDNGDAVEKERIIVPGANTFSTIYFKSESIAYASVAGGISKLIIFNPTTMRITGEVSLTLITKRFPKATRTYYKGMIERDGKLFMGVHYEKNFSPVNDSAYVAVIDLNTRTVEKVIVDDRTGMIFGGETGPCMIKEKNGDIYIQALGTTNAGGNGPSGVLRIKNGQTDFDSSYFFNLEKAVGNICYGIYPTANGLTFTKKVEDETDFWEFKTKLPQFKYVKINLASKTSEGVVKGLPTSYKRSMIVKSYDNNTLLFTTSTNDENAVYSYDIATGNVSKKFTSTGGYITGLEQLNQ
ncbi:DUF4374 domain-containing protein [Polaribacter cellanae]|uniref:DUF4374 domain-containing protein n=1 Tax=Polaribacter cellanae TaxID=2818493 RepID=A0A975H6Q7_9FLAO|nr:DUF4374 domain-containing protein [Polaribacter cellanae]QTE22711.1 DUF4374 domain-containing protein [Polaribacter cellanae]